MPDKTADTSFDDLKIFLEKLFQFENADLNFGIYKILNYKKSEIQNFINNLLTKNVREQLNLLAAAENQNLAKQLQELESDDVIKSYIRAVIAKDENKINFLLADFKTKIEQYVTVKSRYELHEQTEKAEPHIYKHLALFFSRYYDKGDFVSKRRYGKTEKYMIPYNGEETYFYWANADQYYIKSSEFFRKYSFRIAAADGRTIVNFKLKDADEEQGNVRSEENKYFILAENPLEILDSEINISFEYRGLTDAEKNTKGNNQAKLNEYALPLIKKALGNNTAVVALFTETDGKNKLGTELNRYTSRNKYDFFIHKNLKGFLSRELDFYIKSELLKLDDLTVFDSETHFETIRLQFKIVKTFKNIATTIIDFISQIEDFQKKLWEKKKFVIDTHYVITLDKLAAFTSAEFTDSVLKDVIANASQVQEWKELFGEGIFADWNKIKIDQVKNDKDEYRKLPIDTKHFSEDFKWKLLCEISKKKNIDEECDGLLMNSDNFHGLKLLENKYTEKIKSIYLDPPYNTNASELIYKNNFKHSTWASFIQDRMIESNKLMTDDGIMCITIDHVELKTLQNVISSIYPSENMLGIISILNNPSGRSTVKGVSIANEYALIVGKSESARVGFLKRTKRQEQQYDEKDSNGSFQWRYFLRSGGANDFRRARPKLFYPLLIIDDNNVRLPNMVWNESEKSWEINEEKEENETIVYPVTNDVEYTWRLGVDTLKNRLNDLRIRRSRNGKLILEVKFYQGDEGVLPKTMWLEKEYNATAYGTSLLRNLFGEAQLFSFPKSPYAVLDSLRVTGLVDGEIALDYFAGSGTTFHAVQLLNNEDNIKRKTILMEQAQYAHNVTIPRIKKIAMSFDWQNGSPKNENGLGIFFKYHRLEQYEESLENIAFSNMDTTQIQLAFNDYIPKYFLNFETADSPAFLNIDAMQDPFDYELKVFNEYEYVSKKVDVIETFNYLAGLFIKGYEVATHQNRKYIFVSGADRQNKNMIVVWRSAIELDYEQDRDFIEQQLLNKPYETLYVNGQCAVEGAQMTEEVFKTRMN